MALPPEKEQANQERYAILGRLENWLEMPMVVLGFVWLVLLIAEFVWSLTPFLRWLGLAIWGVFIIDFLLKFTLAPAKLEYVKETLINSLTIFCDNSVTQ